MTYQAELLAHLTRYRHSTLLVDEPGTFAHRGREVVREHILPTSEAWLNLLEPQREFIRGFLGNNSAIKRHRYFHHLNSSQAFAFNLFVPYFEGGAASSAALLRAFDQQSPLKSWQAEAVPNEKEGTNVDACWKTEDGQTTYCEVKLSEADFGKAKHDAPHLKKLRDTYAPRLAGVVDSQLLQPEEFFRSYQILRNVWLIAESEVTRLNFLLPRGNAPLWGMLAGVLHQVKSPVRDRISLFAVEDILAKLQSDEACPSELREYARQLEAKYIPAVA